MSTTSLQDGAKRHHIVAERPRTTPHLGQRMTRAQQQEDEHSPTNARLHQRCSSSDAAARRFVRSTQNKIRRAASGVSDRQNAAALHSMHSMLNAARARRTSPQDPGDPPSRHVKNNVFPSILEGFGRKPSNYQRAGPWRQLASVGVA